MNMNLRDRFLELWSKHFGSADLPMVLFYSNDESFARLLRPLPGEHVCLIAQLAVVRQGQDLSFEEQTIGCNGGKRYLGFMTEVPPSFAYFLSCGIPGKLEGERYKKSPDIVREWMQNAPRFTASAKYAVFKRWDRLEERDDPEVVIFFAAPDVLSGLFTLAGFDQADLHGVIAPFGAGCATIAAYPCLEGRGPQPRAVLGMFDVSARPCVPANALSFAVPISKFVRMVENMDESFLITGSWAKVRRRIASGD